MSWNYTNEKNGGTIQPEPEPEHPLPPPAEADAKLMSELKAYRLAKSREEGLKPYYIFNDLQMEDLIAKMPVDKECLMGVNGFGPVKTGKYGKDLIEILDKYRNA